MGLLEVGQGVTRDRRGVSVWGLRRNPHACASVASSTLGMGRAASNQIMAKTNSVNHTNDGGDAHVKGGVGVLMQLLTLWLYSFVFKGSVVSKDWVGYMAHLFIWIA